MSQSHLHVVLLAHTPNPTELLYASLRQCYHDGFVGDMWEKLHNGTITKEQQESLIRQVLASGHMSPIEHITFTFAVEGVSRALSHQLVRHRIASYSQQSQRYVDGSNFSYIMPPAIEKNPKAKERFLQCLEEIQDAYQSIKGYLEEDNRKGSKANEDARFVLPQAAETRIVFTMNCRSLFNFFEHRCCTRAQWEIRALANEVLRLCKETAPLLFEHAGAKCEALGYCPESEKFACGKYPTQEALAQAKKA